MRSSRAAFSLLEMSIVLAVIGLLMGGVVMGKNLLRNMQVKRVMDDATTYARAIYQFKDKYSQLPGDFDSAINIWGSSATLCSGTTNTTTGTCNGDGNGVVSSAGAASVTGEGYQLWRQLMLAGFIKGSFSGAAGSGGGNHAVPGTNTPVTALKNTTFWLYSWGDQAGGTTFYTGNYDSTMVFGALQTNAWDYQPALTGKEAGEIDKKMDDGYPAFGTIRTLAATWSAANAGVACSSSDTAASAVYVKTGASPTCHLLFMSTFQAPAHNQ